MEVFWQGHDPSYKQFSRQYQAFVFYHDEEQRKIAEKTRDAVAAELKRPVKTEIVPAGTFYQAEDYHQKYYLVYQRDIKKILEKRYPDFRDFVGSTAVARLNGYAGGYVRAEELVKELQALGWTQPQIAEVLEAAGEDVVALCPVRG